MTLLVNLNFSKHRMIQQKTNPIKNEKRNNQNKHIKTVQNKTHNKNKPHLYYPTPNTK